MNKHDPEKLRASRIIDQHSALGFIVEYISFSEIFGGQAFGDWSRQIMGQINRNHYLLAWRSGRVVGFVGWSRCDRQQAKMWLEGRHDDASDLFKHGPCLIINIWMADDKKVTNFLRKCLREEAENIELVFAKRALKCGGWRKICLKVPNSL